MNTRHLKTNLAFPSHECYFSNYIPLLMEIDKMKKFVNKRFESTNKSRRHLPILPDILSAIKIELQNVYD